MKQYESINLYRDGVSFRKIAQRLDVDRKSVSKICHRYQEGLEAVRKRARRSNTASSELTSV